MTTVLILSAAFDATMLVIGALIIGLRQYRMHRRIGRRVDALMLAHQTYHAEGRGGQTANDNQQKYSIKHRFISSY